MDTKAAAPHTFFMIVIAIIIIIIVDVDIVVTVIHATAIDVADITSMIHHIVHVIHIITAHCRRWMIVDAITAIRVRIAIIRIA